MKIFLSRSLSAGVIVLLTSWLLAAEVGAEGEDVQDFVFLAEARPVLVRLHVRIDGKPLPTAWDDFMKYLFAYLDVNGDGVLDKQEVERAPTVNQLVNFYGAFNQSGNSAEVKRDALDSDKDGKVSLAELSVYYRKNGFQPFQFQLDMTPPAASAAMALYMGGARPDPEVAALGKAIFALLDTDKDGKLTQKELEAAPKVLLARDENEDEIITGQELVPQEKPKSDFLSMAMTSVPKKASAAGNPFLVPITTRGQAPSELARRMQERYDPNIKKATTKPFDKLSAPPPPKTEKKITETSAKPLSSSKTENVKDAKEKDKEKKIELLCRLTRNQLGLDKATFALLDSDKSGVLDAKEIVGFVQRPPDLCMIFSFGDKAGKPLDLATVLGRPAALADNIRIQDTVSLLDLGATRMELRRGEEKNGYNRLLDIVRQQFSALFKTADKDNNGYLDEKEVRSRREFKLIFKQIDRDGDGKISEKDLVAYLDAMTELQQRATGACVTLVLRDQSRGLFDVLDSDRDGRLSLREIKQAPKLLAMLNRQGKGYVEAKDIPPCYQLTLRRGAAEMGFNQERFFIERLFGDRGEETVAGRGPAWFRKMDRNRDGDVSRKEFLFSEELFRRLDADGDGLISLEEAENAGK